MIAHRRRMLLLLPLVPLTVLCLGRAGPGYAGSVSGSDIAVIVNSGVSEKNLSLEELRTYLLGDKLYWKGNKQRVTLLIQAPGARERDVILRKIYKMSEAQFRQYWIAKVFRAEAPSSPKVVYSSDMAVSLVSRIPGAISFVEGDKASPPGVDLVRIDGHLPGEKDYPLR